jgi:hypothetical protein
LACDDDIHEKSLSIHFRASHGIPGRPERFPGAV